jgi:hypothetical protein
MLTTAVAASRLVHPHIVSVYDAVDEGHLAYLVREWVNGVSLRDVLRQAPLDAERATLVTHAIAEALAALHAAGIVHGNVHPGTILIADDGRVVLADAHADGPADAESDVRALGAVLYACLTGHWPYAEGGHGNLPEAVRDASGRLASPRQVRGGIPRYLDEVASDLLDARTTPPPAGAIAADFARLATQGAGEEFDADGPMGFSGEGAHSRRRFAWAKLALGIAVLTAIAVVGALVAVNLLDAQPDVLVTPPANAASPTPTITSNVAGPAIAIGPGQVRIVDPPKTDSKEIHNAALTVDGDPNTGWTTDGYNQPNFGGLKPGMGVLIDLGKPTTIGAVKVETNQKGATVALKSGPDDPGVGLVPGSDAAKAADDKLRKSYKDIAAPFIDSDGPNMVFSVDTDAPVQYLLVWVTVLPPSGSRYRLTINEITVYAAG